MIKAPPPKTIAAPKIPTLYPKQREAIFCPARYSIIEASTKCGKTAGALIWLLVKAWNEGQPGRNYWWVAPVFAQANEAFERMSRMLLKSDPKKTAFSVNLTARNIRLANGAVMWFKGSDNPDSLYGSDVYAAVIDEASRCRAGAFYAVRSTLTATQGPIRIIGNVRGRRNWSFQLARRAELGELPDARFFKLTAYDAVEAGVLAAEEIEDARRSLPDHVFRELYLAEPSDDGGNPFGIQAIERCVGPLSLGPAVAFGVDLAKSKDWAVVCGLDESAQVCVLERWRSDWGQTLRRVYDHIGDTPALIDSTGVGDPVVEELARHTSEAKGFKFSNQSKQQIVEGLAVAIQRGEVRFPDGWLRTELESFEYVYTNGRVKYSAPEGMTDDGVYALALAYQQLRHRVPAWTADDFAVFAHDPRRTPRLGYEVA